MVTIGVLSIDDPREFGIVDLDNNHIIHRFKEKPGPGEIFSNLASTGIYALNPEILDYIPKEKYDFAKDLFPRLLKDNKRISGWLAHGLWTDVGNPRAYREAQRWMLENMPGTTIQGRLLNEGARLNGPINIGNNVTVGKNTVVVGPVYIGENTVIGDNVLIGPYTSIGNSCHIASDCRILSSYIYNGVKIGQGCSVSGPSWITTSRSAKTARSRTAWSSVHVLCWVMMSPYIRMSGYGPKWSSTRARVS